MQHMKHTAREGASSRFHLRRPKTGNGPLSEKLRKRLAGVGAVLVAAAVVVGAVVGFNQVASAAPNSLSAVDPDTTNVWTGFTRPGGQPSTQNVGRIWTDKSVFDDTYTFTNDNDAGLSGETIEKGGSDFLVSLSALSSTSNLKEMVKTSQPLDIVLVLDTSGSMSGSKMTNLKNAANSFIDATAENNRGLEQNQQTRLAIVQFANGANTAQQLNYVTDQNAQQYKNTINGFRANGSTYAEEGLQQAQNVLDRNGRDNVQQIVIFFTDGVPTTYNTFDSGVANTAVSNSFQIKNDRNNPGTVYSIGIFDDADPDVHEADNRSPESTKANTFMNAVSSNYPSASSWNQLGQRVNDEAAYYKTASDSATLSQIFQDIFDESTENVGSGSPIEEVEHQGAVYTPGYLTFTDKLGDYMQV